MRDSLRVPREDMSLITIFLDSGVLGVILLQIEDTAVVREASSHTQYERGRSLASSSRATKFSHVSKADYADYVNNDLRYSR